MTISLKVKPGSKVDMLFYDAAGSGREKLLTAKIKAPAQDGKANAYLVEFLAKQLGVAKSGVAIVSGHTSQHKRVAIDVSEEHFSRFQESLGI
ncbi:DUF167 domain-containing protein [Spirosoma montaniterrae]|uniref:UPF0235 protein AWR27_18470 n=1 Tax=Spirosoma montaniterrae TaxID=1178516 RepID=A0A1P9X0H0_9BACT|nr:DUF167 domain-containing protein [Spirosoma montaniterrae]AQG81130.1 hypothetical protein AWR27_18470 [Spirosoma montaniterrae]